MKKWLKAMRLRTLPLACSCILLGSGLSLKNGFFNGTIFWGMLLTMVFMQILSNLANDLGDSLKGTDNDDRVGPTRAIQSGEISISQMKKALWLFGLLSFGTGFWTLNQNTTLSAEGWWIILGLGLISIVAALGYTLGKKAYGYLGLGDLSVLLFFGPIGVVTTAIMQGSSFSSSLLLASLGTGLLSVGVLNLNNMRDINNDANSGKKTLVVLMGANLAKVYHHLLIFTSITIWAWIFDWKPAFTFPILFLAFAHLRHVRKVTDPKKFNPALPMVAIGTFLISLTFFIVQFNA
ncbi:MAG: 1,4-dihydroxy-2-naphthoate octaprenyltransferase [Sphingobacteriales bacterium]|jgi:1,4-dihydroxy-2-naphthoate octaprenyltransferase